MEEKKISGKKQTKTKFKKQTRLKDLGHSLISNSVYKDNDPSWYKAEGQILKDAGSLSFASMLGVVNTLRQNSANIFEVTGNNGSFIQPGILTLYFNPTYGSTYDPIAGRPDGTSALNTASRSLYSFVRHANSGSRNYDSPDLMLYILAMEQAHSWLAQLSRLYGTLRLYSKTNRYYAESVVRAQGYDFDDLQLHINDLRAFINVTAYKLQSMAVPNNMSLFNRRKFINENIFTDSTLSKNQAYIFVQRTWLKFSATGQETGGSLQETSFKFNGTQFFTFEQLVDFTNEIINPIISDEDMNIMSGDIIKAFGDDILKISTMPDDYFTYPVYSHEMLQQIRNASICTDVKAVGGIDPATGFAVVQEDGLLVTVVMGLISGPVTPDYKAMALDRYFTIDKESPTPDDVMVSSRLLNIASYVTYDEETADAAIFFAHSGTEVICDVQDYNLLTKGFDRIPAVVSATAAIGNQFSMNTLRMISRLFKFDYAPAPLLVTGSVATNTDLDYAGEFGDLGMYTVVTESTAAKLHDAAIINQFTCHRVAKAIKVE